MDPSSSSSSSSSSAAAAAAASSSSTIATASSPLHRFLSHRRRHRHGFHLLPLILASIAFLSMFLPQTLNLSHALSLLLPSLGSVCFVFLPSLWNSFHSCLSRPCLFILLHCIIVLLTALSGCFKSSNNSDRFLDSDSFWEKKKKEAIETKKNRRNAHSLNVSIAKLSVSPWQVKPTVSSWRVSAEKYWSDGSLEAGFGNSEDYHCRREITVQDYGDAFSSQDAIGVPRLRKSRVAPNRFILHENHGGLENSALLLDTFPSREGRQNPASSRIDSNDEEASGRERLDATEEERHRIEKSGEDEEMDVNGKLEMVISKQHDGHLIMPDKLGHSEPSSPRSNQISVAKKSTRRSTSLDSSPKDQKHHNLAVTHESSLQNLSEEAFRKLVEDYIWQTREKINRI